MDMEMVRQVVKMAWGGGGVGGGEGGNLKN